MTNRELPIYRKSGYLQKHKGDKMKHYHAVNPDDTCEWIYNDDDECWDTNCDEKFQFIDGTPLNNGFEYCPYCGRKLVEKS